MAAVEREIGSREFRTMSGVAFLEAIAQGTLPPAPMAELMDFRLCEVEAGRVAFEGRPAACHYNPVGTVHGGYAATLLDSAMGCAVHSVLEAGMGYTTLEIKVNLVRPITVETGPVRAEGSLLHRGRRTATSQARLVDADGRLLAHATCTCLLFPL
jgi:uncharacterized protein (TIGR00369 family)